MTRFAALALGLCLSFGCSGSGTDTDMGTPVDGGADASVDDAAVTDAASDAGSDDGGMSKPVTIGIGRDSFMSVAPGETVFLAAGAQGGGRLEGFHIWSAMRIVGLQNRGINVTFTVTTTTGVEVARQNRIFPALEPNGDGFVAYGVAPRISDCCLADRRDVVLAVSVMDTDGVSASDEVTVRTEGCYAATNGQDLCL